METTSSGARPLPRLEAHLGYLLRRVSNAVSAGFSHALQARQTSVAEWVLLRELHERNQATPGQLAECLGLTRGAVSKIVDKLEAKGWVRTGEQRQDSRFRLLSLTPPGRRNLPGLAKIADRNDAAFFDCLTATEKAVLRKLLLKLTEQNRIHNIALE